MAGADISAGSFPIDFGQMATIIVAVLFSTVPWAYMIHGRLCRIEQQLKNFTDMKADVHECRERLHAIELAVAAKCGSTDCMFIPREQ